MYVYVHDKNCRIHFFIIYFSAFFLKFSQYNNLYSVIKFNLEYLVYLSA